MSRERDRRGTALPASRDGHRWRLLSAMAAAGGMVVATAHAPGGFVGSFPAGVELAVLPHPMRARIAGMGSVAFPLPAAGDARAAASEAALAAAVGALVAAGHRAREIECVTVASAAGDAGPSGQASVLGTTLGLVGVPAFGVDDHTSAFLYALSVADHFIRLDTYRMVLVAAVDVVPPTSERARGAAAAALVVPEADDARGILGIGLRQDGRFARSAAAEGERGLAPYAGEAIEEALHVAQIAPQDVALVISSPSLHDLEPVACLRLGLPIDRLQEPRPEHPFPAASHLPACLEQAVRTRRIARGDVVLLITCGLGLTWGWALVRW